MNATVTETKIKILKLSTIWLSKYIIVILVKLLVNKEQYTVLPLKDFYGIKKRPLVSCFYDSGSFKDSVNIHFSPTAHQEQTWDL